VMVTHGNLLHAERMIAAAFEHSEESTLVGWLPLYHDMGLVGNVLQPLFIGAHSVLMPPEAFLQHPQRWLQAISRYGATTSGGPNFAYELCARRISPEQLDGVDLSCWSIAFNGAEPVRPRTIAAFSNAFACRGFSERAFYPCYGLAEVTLFASGGTKAARPRLIPIDADALASGTENVAHDTRGQTDPTPDDAVHVACGHGWLDRRIVIADPISGAEQPDGTVGEIWLSGADVTRGYWGRPEETQRTFAASLPNGDGPFLRTGDLGFVVGRELVVTGRSKDVIVVAGRNVYPQEIEATVEDSHPLIRRGCVAAFAYEADGAERVGLVTELRTADVPTEHIDSVAPAIRREVATRHGVALHAVSLIVRGSIAKTSSGKVRRSECRRRMLAGELALLSHSSLESMREAAVPS
jgi:phthiocerol/phenolphthiocerol synthesis type-I polyketide synthase C